ncbi:23S rRNA (guanosine(2251)-2'-O)-methyltransferase RlmB [Acetobacteraceae bacterium]|nr:23S rRNA (guanosine(2251)-2'-O)-methyltransferase RlmB [Acetobacteraceae bacterium]
MIIFTTLLLEFSMSDKRRPSRNRAEKTHRRRSGRNGGSYWLYGLHAAMAALENPDRDILEIRIGESLPDEIYHAISQRRLSAQSNDRQALSELCGMDAVHQGIAMKVNPLKCEMTLEEAAAAKGSILVLDQVTDPRNVGSLLRSAAAFNVAAMIVQDRHAPQENGAMAKTASGALDIVPVIRETNLSRAIEILKKNGRWVVGLDADGESLPKADLTPSKTVLVLGAEGKGMRRLVEGNCDATLSIPMNPIMESFNVSVAGAIALYEINRK